MSTFNPYWQGGYGLNSPENDMHRDVDQSHQQNHNPIIAYLRSLGTLNQGQIEDFEANLMQVNLDLHDLDFRNELWQAIHSKPYLSSDQKSRLYVMIVNPSSIKGGAPDDDEKQFEVNEQDEGQNQALGPQSLPQAQPQAQAQAPAQASRPAPSLFATQATGTAVPSAMTTLAISNINKQVCMATLIPKFESQVKALHKAISPSMDETNRIMSYPSASERYKTSESLTQYLETVLQCIANRGGRLDFAEVSDLSRGVQGILGALYQNYPNPPIRAKDAAYNQHPVHTILEQFVNKINPNDSAEFNTHLIEDALLETNELQRHLLALPPSDGKRTEFMSVIDFPKFPQILVPKNRLYIASPYLQHRYSQYLTGYTDPVTGYQYLERPGYARLGISGPPGFSGGCTSMKASQQQPLFMPMNTQPIGGTQAFSMKGTGCGPSFKSHYQGLQGGLY